MSKRSLRGEHLNWVFERGKRVLGILGKVASGEHVQPPASTERQLPPGSPAERLAMVMQKLTAARDEQVGASPPDPGTLERISVDFGPRTEKGSLVVDNKVPKDLDDGTKWTMRKLTMFHGKLEGGSGADWFEVLVQRTAAEPETSTPVEGSAKSQDYPEIERPFQAGYYDDTFNLVADASGNFSSAELTSTHSQGSVTGEAANAAFQEIFALAKTLPGANA